MYEPRTYLALSIGPIYKTIQRARKTRELWAASFLLSQYMRCILKRMEKEKFGIALSPDVDSLGSQDKYHGAGIWNDNAFYEITADTDVVKRDLPGLLQEAKAEFIDLILTGFRTGKTDSGKTQKWPFDQEAQLTAIIGQHFHCKAVLHTRLNGQTEIPILKELNRLLNSADQLHTAPPRYDDWVSTAMFHAATVLALYNKGFDVHDPVFTPLRYGRRLPSLMEIATREFKKEAHKGVYNEVVKVIEANYGDNDDNAETDAENISILKLLKAEKDANGQTVFRKRHKYLAIVQSDGDGVGSHVTNSPDLGYVKRFSKQLMNFSKSAVQKIVGYDGLPVYAGGDDLLFIAPLRNAKDETLFDLLKKLNDAFAEQPILHEAGGTLSFGVSIFYYKSPMSESLEEGRKQLFQIAKKLKYKSLGAADTSEKNALAFRVLLHGGQAFGAAIQQKGKAWDRWAALLKDAQSTNDLAFISGLVHRLELLGILLEAACDNGNAEHFFKNHFNEARGKQLEFVEKVRDLAIAIYEQYGTLDFDDDHIARTFFKGQFHIETRDEVEVVSPKNRRRHYCNNLLYSALRLIQFQQAEDND